jgi:hypothetical protein
MRPQHEAHPKPALWLMVLFSRDMLREIIQALDMMATDYRIAVKKNGLPNSRRPISS